MKHTKEKLSNRHPSGSSGGECMTALIKSTDGSGWVEARVGDVVRFSTSEVNSLVCELPAGDNISIMLMDFNDNVSPKYWAAAESCQLIERPFQVGDEIQTLLPSGRWSSPTFLHEKSPVLIDVDYAKRHAGKFRHSSPLLRPVGGV